MNLKNVLILMLGAMASITLQADISVISSVEQYAQLRLGQKPVLAMFTASWCGPCKATKPHFTELEKLYGDTVAFCLIDIDDKKLAPLCADIKGVPTFVGICKGQETLKKIGGQSREQLQDILETLKAEASGQKREPMKVPELTQEEYFQKGKECYARLVAECSKPELELAVLQVASDPALMSLSLTLSDQNIEVQKKAFDNVKAFYRGAKTSIETYRVQNKSTHDGLIRYCQHAIDRTLSAPDYATYLAREMKIATQLSEKLQKRTQELMLQIMAEMDLSVL